MRLGLVFECGPGEAPRVSGVEPGSPAEAAGVLVHDRVQSVRTGAEWGASVHGISQKELAARLSDAPGQGQVVLQLARPNPDGAGVSVFSTVIRRDAHLPLERQSEPPPRWRGQAESERVQLADGTKRDRDFFETGADIVDSLWAKPTSKARSVVRQAPPVAPPAEASRHQHANAKFTYSSWDPFGSTSPQIHRSRSPAARQRQAPDVEHTRMQRLRESSKGLWSPAGEVRKTGVSRTGDRLPPVALPVLSDPQTMSGSSLRPGLDQPPMRKSTDWYLVQQSAAQPYATSQKMATSDAALEKAHFTPEGFMDVAVLEAHDLPMATSPFGLCDAYCTVNVSGQSLRTRVVHDTLSPAFHTILRFPKPQPQTISIRVMNQTLLGGSEIGSVTVPWEDVQEGRAKEYGLFAGGKMATGPNQAASRLIVQTLVGPGTVGGLLDATSRGAEGMLPHQMLPHQAAVSHPLAHTQSQSNGVHGDAFGPAHLSSTQGVTLTVDQDYLAAKHNEQVWQSELARDVCQALRCNPACFRYVGMRQGSVLATYNVIPPAQGEPDQRTARNLASELTLQVYDAKSPLKMFPMTAKVVKVRMHAPQKPQEGLLGRGVPLPAPQASGGSEVRQMGAGGGRQGQQVVFGTNAYSALLEKSLDALGVDKAPRANMQGDAVADARRGAVPRPAGADEAPEQRAAFGAEALLPVMNRVLSMPGSGAQGASVATPAATSAAPQALAGASPPEAGGSSAPAPQAAPQEAAPPEAAGASGRAAAAGSQAAMRMRLDMPFDPAVVGHEGSAQRASFTKAVASDLSAASGLPDSSFNLVAVSRGSVIVDTEIYAPAGRDALAAALDLQNQARYALASSVPSPV